MSQGDQRQVAASVGAGSLDQFIFGEVTQILGPGEEILQIGMVFEPVSVRKALPSMSLWLLLGAIAEVICAGPLRWPAFPGMLPTVFCICVGVGWPLVQGRRWFVAATSHRVLLIRTGFNASRVNRGVERIDRASISQIKRFRGFGMTTYTLVLDDGQKRQLGAELGNSFFVKGQAGLTALLDRWRRESRGA